MAALEQRAHHVLKLLTNNEHPVFKQIKKRQHRYLDRKVELDRMKVHVLTGRNWYYK